MGKFFLTYEVNGTGWADAVWGDGKRVKITASYLHDSLRQLAQSVLDLRNGSQSKVIFLDEPGEHHVLLTKSGSDIDYQIRWYDDWASWGMQSEDRFNLVHEGVIPQARYEHQVRQVLDRILETMGEDEYREKWVEHDFPKDEYRAVCGGD